MCIWHFRLKVQSVLGWGVDDAYSEHSGESFNQNMNYLAMRPPWLKSDPILAIYFGALRRLLQDWRWVSDYTIVHTNHEIKCLIHSGSVKDMAI